MENMNIYSGFVSGVPFVKKKKAARNRKEESQQGEMEDLTYVWRCVLGLFL